MGDDLFLFGPTHFQECDELASTWEYFDMLPTFVNPMLRTSRFQLKINAMPCASMLLDLYSGRRLPCEEINCVGASKCAQLH